MAIIRQVATRLENPEGVMLWYYVMPYSSDFSHLRFIFCLRLGGMRKGKHNDEGFITIDCHIIIGRPQGKGEAQTHRVTLCVCVCVCVFVCLASCRFSRPYKCRLSADNPSLPPSLRFPLPLSPTVHPQSTSLSPSTDPSTLSSSLPPLRTLLIYPVPRRSDIHPSAEFSGRLEFHQSIATPPAPGTR